MENKVKGIPILTAKAALVDGVMDVQIQAHFDAKIKKPLSMTGAGLVSSAVAMLRMAVDFSEKTSDRESIIALIEKVSKVEARMVSGLDVTLEKTVDQSKPAAALFYIQDTRQIVGNCVLWWAHNGGGYTIDLEQAGLYTEEQVDQILQSRNTDKAWPQEVVQASVMERHVRMEGLHDQEATAKVKQG